MENRGSIRNPLKRARGIIVRIRSILISLIKIPAFLRNPKLAQTRVPNEAQKSRFRILIDLFIWVIRNAEVNKYYFVYGLGKIVSDCGQYMGIRYGEELIRD
jgi:hypothetical protein